jgi:acyl-coenzyme A thioesterase PaaI-like protein
VGEGEEAAQAPARVYPPARHLLRDLRLWIERDDSGARAGLEVVPEMCSAAGCVRAGVLATLVDVAGGESAVRAAAPDWVATSNLALHCLAPVAGGTVEARPSLLRRTRSTVVLEVALHGREARNARVGLATMTFAVLPARTPIQRMGVGADSPRTEFGQPGSGLAAPLPEQLGVRALGAAAGSFELPLGPYVGNSLGALQGGVVAILLDLAAEGAARQAVGADWTTRDLAIHYLALGREGPVCSAARLLRRGTAEALLRAELRDAGAQDRLLAVATASVAAPD